MESVPLGGAAAAVARYRPRSLSEEVADFTRSVVSRAKVTDPLRAKALLFAVGKLGTFAASVALDLDPEVVFSTPVIERFIALERDRLGPATTRTLRSNLRYVARGVLAQVPPDPTPLRRERSKAPYDAAQMAAYLALADAQPTESRRMRLCGLLALGAGAGLMGADLRGVAGRHVVVRSGGVIVEVTGRRPRVVPVLSRYHEALLASADFAGTGFIVGGYSASRRNVTSALVASVAGGVDLAALDTGRLRATWLVEVAGTIGLAAFMDAAGITCSQRLGDLVATLARQSEVDAVSLLGAQP